MNKTIAWLKDGNRWVLFFIIIPLVGYMFLSAFAPFMHNYYAKACQAAGWWWKLAGLGILALGIWLYTKINNDFLQPIALFVFICLMFLAFMGFNY